MQIDFGYAWHTFIKSWPLFAYGIRLTLAFAIVGTVVGLILGLFVGAIHAMEIDPFDKPVVRGLKHFGHFITSIYVWVFRGTPMMVQAVFLYYLLKPVLGWTGFSAGMFIISINTGAYMSEIIRSGIQSIDKGQTEAAKSLGMTNIQTMIYVIFPQAIKNTFPSIGNQLIVNIKDSMRYIEVYMITAILYLILTTIATAILNFLERRINNTKKVSIKSNL